MTPDRNIKHLWPEFADKVEAILTLFEPWCAAHFPGHTAVMAEGFRSTARQEELYAQGRTAPGPIVTEKNGTTNPSKHQSSLAADIVASGPSGLFWPGDSHPFWAYLQHLAHEQGLTSGSDWSGFVDRPHVEWPATDSGTYTVAKAWQHAQGLA